MRKLTGLVVLCLACMGSDCWPTPSSSSSQDGGYVGPGAPSLEVTVDGVHVGPAPTVDGSYADLTTLRNDLGQTVGQNLTIHAVAANASCDLPLTRFGSSLSPFHAAPYQLNTPTGDTTPDGNVSPVGGLTMTAGHLTLKCYGAGCDSSVLAITIMDNAHIEGYLSGTLADPSDGQVSSAVCTFYVPWRTYQP